MTSKTLACALLAVALIATIISYKTVERQRHSSSLNTSLEQITPTGKHLEIPCAEVAATHPLVLLALGQSNAGNHGSIQNQTAEPVTLIAEGKCIKASDPLPGGTGMGGSIWQRLPAMLTVQKNIRPIVLSVLAVDATSIEDWTSPGSPLRERLVAHLASMQHLGLAPNLVLWQHGEADARALTSANEYSTGLDRLGAIIDKTATHPPILLASSTICRSNKNATIRLAIANKTSSDRHFQAGPDTDTLIGKTYRYDDCHLSIKGLDSAARMWADSINASASNLSLNPSL